MTTILVIEDEQAVRDSLVDLLNAEGFTTIDAPNGEVGLQLATKILPDLILCDIKMPVMNGYEVIQILKQRSPTASIPFIFLSASNNNQDFRYCMQLGRANQRHHRPTGQQIRDRGHGHRKSIVRSQSRRFIKLLLSRITQSAFRLKQCDLSTPRLENNFRRSSGHQIYSNRLHPRTLRPPRSRQTPKIPPPRMSPIAPRMPPGSNKCHVGWVEQRGTQRHKSI
jgi:CheY-like chemotaxis protein